MIIGIGGCSRSGKSTLASWVVQHFRKKGRKAELISLDDFPLPETEMPEIRGELDWDHPDAYDWHTLETHLRQASQQEDILILEGIFIFHPPAFSPFWDKAIFMTLSKATFLERRARETRWGQEPAWYIDHVWQAFEKYGYRGIPDEHLRLSGENPWDEAELLRFLR